MSFKKIVTFSLILVMCAMIALLGLNPNTATAASSGTVFRGSTTNNSSVAINTAMSGVDAVFNTTSDTGFVTSINTIDLNKYAVEFTVKSKHFDTLYFKFTNTEDSETGFVVTFEHFEETINEEEVTSTLIRVYDTLDFVDTTDTAKVEERISGFDLTKNYIWLEYKHFVNESPVGEGGMLSYRTKVIDSTGGEEGEYTAFTELCAYTIGGAENDVNFSWIEEEISNWKPLKEAALEIGVLGQEVTGDDLGKDENDNAINAQKSFVNFLTVTNSYGTQIVGERLEVRPLIKCSLKAYRGEIIDENYSNLDQLFNAVGNFTFGEEEDEDAIDCIAKNMTGAKGAAYTFPFYTLSLERETSESYSSETEVYYNYTFSNIRLFVKEADATSWSVSADTILKTSTSYTLNKEANTQYAIVFDAKIDNDNNFTFALLINSVKDDVAPEVNKGNFLNWVTAEHSDIFESEFLNAPETGSYIFPDITRSINEQYNIFTDKIGDKSQDELTWAENEDYNNFTVIIGYKKDGATGDYTYGTSTSVSIKSVGEWTFAYTVKDQSGNKTVIYSFSKLVQDITPPTIKVSTPTKEIEVDNLLVVPTATRSDNCSGVDTAKNVYTVYFLDYNLDPNYGYTKDEDDNIEFDRLIQLEQIKIDNGFKLEEKYKYIDSHGKAMPAFIVVYEATDKSGNHTVGTSYGFVKVIEKTTTPIIKSPINEVLEIILIVVGALLIVSLLVLLLVNPQQKKQDSRIAKLATKKENDDKDAKS